jgi:predicted nuclease with TOPRIM domain
MANHEEAVGLGLKRAKDALGDPSSHARENVISLALLELKKENEELRKRETHRIGEIKGTYERFNKLKDKLSALQKENATLTEQLGKAVEGLSKVANNINANLLCDCQGENDEGNLIHEDNCEYRQVKQAVLDLKSIEAGRGENEGSGSL